MRDYYRILGIRPDATQDEIREAWIFGVKAFHPDKFGGSSPRQQAVAQERTKAVNEAYKILSNATLRASYDRKYARNAPVESTSPPSPESTPPPSDSTPRAHTTEKDDDKQATRPASTAPQSEKNRNDSSSIFLFGAGLYIAWLMAGAMLVSAAVGRHPYGFYIVLRWICCPVFAFSAFAAHKKNRVLWLWVFGALAVLYNPIFSVHLDRSTWVGVNWFTVGAIIVAAVTFLPRRVQIWIAAVFALALIAVGLWQLQPGIRPQASVSGPQVSKSAPAIPRSSPSPSYGAAVRNGSDSKGTASQAQGAAAANEGRVSGMHFGFILPKQNLSIFIGIFRPNQLGIAKYHVNVRASNPSAPTNVAKAVLVDQNKTEIASFTVGIGQQGDAEMKLSEEEFLRIYNVTFR